MSIRSRGIPPRQFPVPQQQPQQRPVFQPQQPQMQPYRPPVQAPIAPPMGDPGFGGGLGVSPADLRRLITPIESQIAEMSNRLSGVESTAAGVAALHEMMRVQPQAGFNQADVLAGLGEVVVEGIRAGKCLPYLAGIDVFVPKGVSGVQLPAGEIFISSDGPMFITELLAFAQIDPDDPDAATYPLSLIRSPSCSDAVDCPDAFISANEAATFTASQQSLIPSLNAQGRYIPVSPRNCHIISPAVETTCYTLDCADGTDPRQYSAQVPIVLLDHPECVDGLVDIQTNGCQWQNQSFPIAFFEDAMFNLTANTPGPLGVCGFLDCNKRLDVRFQPTRPHRYNINLTFIFAGFRIVTCGTGACGIG